MGAVAPLLVVLLVPSSTGPAGMSSFNVSFEGGNADPVATRWLAKNTLAYRGEVKCGPASTKCSPYTNWAYFSVNNVSTNEDTTLVTLSHEWLSAPFFSYTNGDDGMDWRRFPTSTSGRTVYRFEQPLVYVAFSIPYVQRQRSRLALDLKRLGSASGARVDEFTLANSEAGHAISGVNISSAAEAKKALVWMHARQHAWESGSSWVIDGVGRFAASAAGSRLRAAADVVIIPIMDIDNVVVGGAGKDQEPVDFNRDWCPVGHVERNGQGNQYNCTSQWKAVQASAEALGAAMSSGRYSDLIFVDSHSPGDAEEPAQIWHECLTGGPTAVSSGARGRLQHYKAALRQHSADCGRLHYTGWCAEMGPTYGTSLTAHNAFEVSLMHMYYRAFPMWMNASGSRSMSFSHETSGTTVNETRCYGAAIGVSLEQVLSATGSARSSHTAAPTRCRGIEPNTCVFPPPPVPHHAAFDVVGAGSADCNGRYSYRPSPPGWPDRAPFYEKDELHSLYRYHGRWYICHTGRFCYYDAPATPVPSPEPPPTGWSNDGNRTGAAPAPTLRAVSAMSSVTANSSTQASKSPSNRP